MGSFNKRMKKKQQQAEAVKTKQQNSELETQLSNQIKAKQYEKALDTLTELVKQKNVSPEAMYEGALAYFMMGDYARAATWVNNTLSFAPGHVRARLLLARICVQQDRRDDAFAVIDFILDKGKGSLREDELSEIKNIVGICGKSERERIRKSFPNVAEILDQNAEEKGDIGIAEDASQLLSKLKAKLEDRKNAVKSAAEQGLTKSVSATDQVERIAADTVERVSDRVSAISNKTASTAELLKALKEKVNAINTKKETKAEDEIIDVQPLPADDEGKPKNTDDAVEKISEELAEEISEEISEEIAENLSTKITNALFGDDSSKKAPDEALEVSSNEPSEAANIREEILSRRIPATEKVKILNAYAGDYYYRNRLEDAEILLKAALNLDIDDATLRNIAVVYHDMGQQNKALELAGKMHTPDFTLLRILKND